MATGLGRTLLDACERAGLWNPQFTAHAPEGSRVFLYDGSSGVRSVQPDRPVGPAFKPATVIGRNAIQKNPFCTATPAINHGKWWYSALLRRIRAVISERGAAIC